MGFILQVINTLFYVYMYMIIGYVLMSWFPNLRESTIGQVLGRLVEPYLAIFRRIIPPLGPLDLSPIVAIIALSLAQSGLVVVVGFIISTLGFA